MYARQMYLMKRFLPVLFTIIFCASLDGVAQSRKNYLHQSQYWLRYTNRLEFNKHVSVFSETENRRFFPIEGKSMLLSDLQNSFLIRSILYGKLGEGWTAGVGLAYFLLGNPDPASN